MGMILPNWQKRLMLPHPAKHRYLLSTDLNAGMAALPESLPGSSRFLRCLAAGTLDVHTVHSAWPGQRLRYKAPLSALPFSHPYALHYGCWPRHRTAATVGRCGCCLAYWALGQLEWSCAWQCKAYAVAVLRCLPWGTGCNGALCLSMRWNFGLQPLFPPKNVGRQA